MENYNFWQDFFDTYQSLSDWTKALWLVVPPTFILGVTALVLRYRLNSKRIEAQQTGRLKYTVHCDETGNYRLYTHDGAGRTKTPASGPSILPLPVATSPRTCQNPPSDA